ncbi:uncharacterized protein LY89DRAFT_728133 [Mollisia scopiformis]|uniref:Uncharacterized protein n=1 Tax=Mollisia scopiformis TaxID=149040 RepID=A0A194XSU9_MOLSC|nr:uncharacterized protein LY89DRAFT_728133 [Mollisia scopiformis]KUJ23380.1 hypothetical protein LY89DRAFT_728133 [Mollisia scopiformis]
MSPTKEKFEASVESQMDEAAANHPEHGLVLPGNEQKPGPLDAMAYNVVDDSLYNVLHDLLMSTYREEKIARCNTAAILLEEKAQKALDPESSSTLDSLNIQAGQAKIKTETAYFDVDGNTSLLQDEHVPFPPVLEAVPIVYCLNCRLPRFPYPTEGVGSREPDAETVYCKKHVYVKNHPADIYNQRYTIDQKGPGRGNGRKKDKAQELTPNGSQDSPAPSPPSNNQNQQVPLNHSKCPLNCGRHIAIKKMGWHLQREHANGSRTSSKAAMEKIQKTNGYTSSRSRNSTPAPANGSKGRTSPNKRDLDDFDSDESPQKPKKARNGATKPKVPSTSKTSSQISNSNLNHVETHASDDEYDDGDDRRDGDFGSTAAKAKRKDKTAAKPTKSKVTKDTMKNGNASKLEKKPKKTGGKTPAPASKKPRPVTPPDSKATVKPEVNGQEKKEHSGPRGSSESSQTLSSPN